MVHIKKTIKATMIISEIPFLMIPATKEEGSPVTLGTDVGGFIVPTCASKADVSIYPTGVTGAVKKNSTIRKIIKARKVTAKPIIA